MACHLFSAKPLSKTMLGYCQLNPWKQTSVNIKMQNFSLTKMQLKIYIICEMAAILSRGSWVKCPSHGSWQVLWECWREMDHPWHQIIGLLETAMMDIIVYQQQLSRTCIIHYIPQLCIGCDYLSMPHIPASVRYVLGCKPPQHFQYLFH